MTGPNAIRLEKTLFGLLLVVLIWAPIPLGSNRPWAWSALEIAVFVLVAGWLLLWGLGKAEVSESIQGAWPAFATLIAWLIHQLIHLIPLPLSWVAFLSPEAASMHHL